MEKKLDFTDSAKKQIERITKSDKKKYFRISVKGGGCSGFKYSFSFEDKLEKNDILFDKVIIDKEAGSGVVPYLPLPELKKATN